MNYRVINRWIVIYSCSVSMEASSWSKIQNVFFASLLGVVMAVDINTWQLKKSIGMMKPDITLTNSGNAWSSVECQKAWVISTDVREHIGQNKSTWLRFWENNQLLENPVFFFLFFFFLGGGFFLAPPLFWGKRVIVCQNIKSKMFILSLTNGTGRTRKHGPIKEVKPPLLLSNNTEIPR